MKMLNCKARDERARHAASETKAEVGGRKSKMQSLLTDSRRWLTVSEAAGYLGVSRTTLYRLIRDDELAPGGRVGRSLRFDSESLDGFVRDGGIGSDDEGVAELKGISDAESAVRELMQSTSRSLAFDGDAPSNLGRGDSGLSRLITDPNGVLTVQQAADYLQVSSRTITRLMQSGQLTWHRVGRGRRVRAADLQSFLRRQELR